IEVLADAVGDRPAVIMNDGRRSYAELDDRATRLANHLAAAGIRAGDHVGIHSRNRIEWVEAFYACFKIRAVPININYRYVEGELRYLYEDADVAAVVVEPEFAGDVERLSPSLPELRYTLVIEDDYEAALAAASMDHAFEERSEDDRYIVYTGGTTGIPKGVMWRQEDIVLGALNAYRQGAPIERVEQLGEEALERPPMRLMMMGPLMHGGTQWAMANVHVSGGTAIIASLPHFDAHAVLEMAAEHQPNSLTVIGDAMARPILAALSAAGAPPYDLSSLMAISNGGAPLSAGVRDELRKAVPNAMLVDSYGSSETGTTGIDPAAAEHPSPRFMVGPETTVLDAEFKVCPPCEVGYLARSGHIPVGYHRDPEATAATFPEIDGKRWAISGDFARIEEDGTISILGRGSVSINSGGEKIFPEEVESALTLHEGVADAAVVGTPHPRWGEQVTALVRPREGWEPSEEALREHCRAHIAGYKIPKVMLFVDSIPRTPVGKVDYPVVAARAKELLGQT
ncbi:MAG: acyl-CoA synthetase, partial [Actinomycetota bacterium]